MDEQLLEISEFELNLLNEMEESLKSLDKTYNVDNDEKQAEKFDAQVIDIENEKYFGCLPLEIIILILNNLDVASIVNFTETCKSNYAIANSSYCEPIWKRHFMELGEFDSKIDENKSWKENYSFYKKYLEVIKVYEYNTLIYSLKKTSLKCHRAFGIKAIHLNLSGTTFLNGKPFTFKSKDNSFTLSFCLEKFILRDNSISFGNNTYSIIVEQGLPPVCRISKLGGLNSKIYKVVGTTTPVVMLFIFALETTY